MGQISVWNLQPGMVLESAVIDSRGRHLLTSGTPLSQKHLEILKARGVTEVGVEDVTQEELDAREIAEIGSQFYEAAQEETGQRFRHCNLRSDVTQELQRVITLRRAKSFQKGASPASFACMDSLENETVVPESKIKTAELLREEDVKLPSLPAIYNQIQREIERPNSSAMRISQVIGTDTSLATRILRVVNSPFYGFRSKVDTLSRAVTLLGTGQVCQLALGISILNTFRSIPSDFVSMMSFWAHSVASGLCAKAIGETKGLPNPERLFLGGLLHDLGRLILYSHFPDHARVFLDRAKQEGNLLLEAEKDILGWNHAHLGGKALKEWNFPPGLRRCVQYHHDPRNADEREEAAIIHVADIIVNAMGIGSSGERFVPPMAPGIWSLLELPTTVFPFLMSQVDANVEETVRSIIMDD